MWVCNFIFWQTANIDFSRFSSKGMWQKDETQSRVANVGDSGKGMLGNVYEFCPPPPSHKSYQAIAIGPEGGAAAAQ